MDLPDTPGDYLERVNKNGAKRYYLKYDYLVGHLVGASRESTDYGDQIVLYFRDADQSYVLRIMADSKYARSLYYRMGNIDLSRPLTVTPYDFVAGDGKRMVGLSLKQDDVKIEGNLPQDEIPPIAVKTRAGKTTYDDTDRYNYFIEKFDVFCSQFDQSSPDVFDRGDDTHSEVLFDDDSGDDDGLPF